MNPVISFDAIRRIVGQPVAKYVKADWHSMTIQIRYLLSIQEYIELVHKIIDMCTTPSGEFAVELSDFALRSNIIIAYSMIEMPSDYTDMYAVAYDSGLYEAVLGAANAGQIQAIQKYIELYAMQSRSVILSDNRPANSADEEPCL